VGSFEAALVDPTPACAAALCTLLDQAVAALAEAAAATPALLPAAAATTLFSTAALLLLSLESAAATATATATRARRDLGRLGGKPKKAGASTANKGQFNAALLVSVQRALTLGDSLHAGPLAGAETGALAQLLEATVLAAIHTLHPTDEELVGLYWRDDGEAAGDGTSCPDYSAPQVKRAALQAVTTPAAARHLVSSPTATGSMALDASKIGRLLDIAISADADGGGGAGAGTHGLVVAALQKLQSELLAGLAAKTKGAADDIYLYSAALFTKVTATVDEASARAKGGAGLLGSDAVGAVDLALGRGVGALLPGWLAGVITRESLPLDGVLPLAVQMLKQLLAFCAAFDLPFATASEGATYEQKAKGVVREKKEETVESAHPYRDSTDWSKTITFPAMATVSITFDPQCRTERSHDYLQISTPHGFDKKFDGE
jgi:hypothetical protein